MKTYPDDERSVAYEGDNPKNNTSGNMRVRKLPMNFPKPDRAITDLQYAARRAKDDETRNTAIISLRRARQPYSDLQQTTRNLKQCKTALQGITGVLDSMHLKVSNIKVNTHKVKLLDNLSSNLETEMNTLEQAL